MQNGIIIRIMCFMVYDFFYIFFIIDVYDIICCEFVFDKDIKENFDGWYFQ